MANAALINELYQLSSDIENVKITARLKALKRLDDILNTRNDEARMVLDATDEKDEAGVTWNDLFNSTYEGIMKVQYLLFNYVLYWNKIDSNFSTLNNFPKILPHR